MMGGSGAPTGYDLFFGDDRATAIQSIGDGVDDPEQQQEAGNGAKDDADHRASAGARVDVGIRRRDHGRVHRWVLSSSQSNVIRC